MNVWNILNLWFNTRGLSGATFISISTPCRQAVYVCMILFFHWHLSGMLMLAQPAAMCQRHKLGLQSAGVLLIVLGTVLFSCLFPHSQGGPTEFRLS